MDLRTMRVDQNGSLVRPKALLDVFDRHAHGEATDAELRAAQDAAIRAVIRKQEAVGLPIVSDGEFRRRNFQESFSNAVSGYDVPARAETLTDWREPNNPLHRTEQNFNAPGPAIMTRRPVVERLTSSTMSCSTNTASRPQPRRQARSKSASSARTASPSASPGRNRKPSIRISTNSSPTSSPSSGR